MEELDINYHRIERAIKYLTENFRRQPSLEDAAGHVGLSPAHFQRIFTEWAGISPKKFTEYLTVESLKEELSRRRSVCESAGEAGLSSQSRAYDLFVNIEAVTPGEYKSGGRGLRIEYGFAGSPFGRCFIASTAKGICAMQFTEDEAEIVAGELRSAWPGAEIVRNDTAAQETAHKIFGGGGDGAGVKEGGDRHLTVLLKGTPFRVKVWRALLDIPFGGITTYTDVAAASGYPSAVRAAASAVAANPVAYLIPCHRVIRSEGIIGQYRWGPERKAAILGWEKSKREK